MFQLYLKEILCSFLMTHIYKIVYINLFILNTYQMFC